MKTVKKYKIGIDEAGRGPWLGSVVACALTFCPDNFPGESLLSKITDSKKITNKRREKIFSELIELSIGKKPKVYFGVGVVDNFLIDEINIREANREAMRRALLELERKINFKKIESISIDGNDNYKFEKLTIEPIFVVRGDEKVLEIGAASIIAKVFRDKLIDSYDILYPDLGIEKHKGYGTKKHEKYLTNKKKITGVHRLTYKPIKKLLGKKSGKKKS